MALSRLIFAMAALSLAGCDRGDGKDGAQEAVAPRAAVVETAEVKPFEGARRIQGTATILSPDALVQLDADIKAAAIAAEFSKGQFARFKQTSALARQTVANAERQAQTDETHAHLLQSRLKQTWGEGAPFIADAARLKFVDELASGGKALVRLDFSEVMQAMPHNVRLSPLQGGEEKAVDALWPAPSGNQAMPGVSYFAIIDATPGLRAGDRARVTAERSESVAGVIVPSAAVVIFAGQSWCYIESAKDKYERQPLTLSHPVDDGYVVPTGIPAGARVVVRGASVLLAREAEPGDDEDDDGAGKHREENKAKPDESEQPVAKPETDEPKADAGHVPQRETTDKNETSSEKKAASARVSEPRADPD